MRLDIVSCDADSIDETIAEIYIPCLSAMLLGG